MASSFRNSILLSLRKLKFLHLLDQLRFQWMRIRNYQKNKLFRKTYPQVALPSDYLIYESFQLDYHKYYLDSRETAQWLIRHFAKHILLEDKKILDWGCGPGRIIRHLPELIGNKCEFYGTDYNKDSIAWCSKNIPNVSFNLNSLEAKLPWPDNTFDVIYGISIFTHLSENMHFAWLKELVRILKPATAGGGGGEFYSSPHKAIISMSN